MGPRIERNDDDALRRQRRNVDDNSDGLHDNRLCVVRMKKYVALAVAALAIIAALFVRLPASSTQVQHFTGPIVRRGLVPAPGFPGYDEPAGTEGSVTQSLCVSVEAQSASFTCSLLTPAKVAITVMFGAPAAVAHTSCGESAPVTGAAEVKIIDPDQQVFKIRAIVLHPGVNRDTFKATLPPGIWYYVVSVRRVTRQVLVPWPVAGGCSPQPYVVSAPALLGSVSVNVSSQPYKGPR